MLGKLADKREAPPTSVPLARWLEAQRCELWVWQREHSRAQREADGHYGDDWNHWWAAQFDMYALLPRRIENLIELGCGPYTNARIIREGRSIRRLYCSDPLAKQYVGFEGAGLAEMYRRAEALIDDHPIEECPFACDYFDVTVLINVLDHVRDAPLCLRQASRITRPGGLLVLGQDLTDAQDASNEAVRNDPLHPIRLEHRQIDAALDDRFLPLLYRILPREDGRNPNAHYGTLIFVGWKRPSRRRDGLGK